MWGSEGGGGGGGGGGFAGLKRINPINISRLWFARRISFLSVSNTRAFASRFPNLLTLRLRHQTFSKVFFQEFCDHRRTNRKIDNVRFFFEIAKDRFNMRKKMTRQFT